jgi:hypothetical protein
MVRPDVEVAPVPTMISIWENGADGGVGADGLLSEPPHAAAESARTIAITTRDDGFMNTLGVGSWMLGIVLSPNEELS